MAIDFKRRAISVEDYHRMGDADIFSPDERIELLDGELIVVPPLSPAHATVVDVLAELLFRRFTSRAIVRVQQPIALAPFSEPEPDLSLVTLDRERFRLEHPGPTDVLLVIEIAMTSRNYDLRTKAKAYANAGIRDYWVLEAGARRLHVHREPQPSGYASVEIFGDARSIAPLAFPQDAIAVAEML